MIYISARFKDRTDAFRLQNVRFSSDWLKYQSSISAQAYTLVLYEELRDNFKGAFTKSYEDFSYTVYRPHPHFAQNLFEKKVRPIHVRIR